MARIKNFCGFDLKTGGIIIGYVSFFANILYLIATIEAVLLYVLPQSEEKKKIFGPHINEIETSSIAFPIILFAAVASLYGVIASCLLICGVKTANRKRILWWLIYQPIAILSILAIAIYSIVVRVNFNKEFFSCWIFESLYLIFLVSLLFYVLVHVHYFIVIIELYLELKAQEPEPVLEEPEIKIEKEEELQLLESPKLAADETDKPEGEGEAAATESKEEAPKPSRRIRCPELPKCPSFKCPSIGNCVGPDNFE